MAANLDESIEKELADLKSLLGKKSLKNVLIDIDQELKLFKNTTLHVAVTGNTGAGKSSFVNAFRNIADDKDSSAKTGVEQTTMEPQKYPNDIFPEITLWDLPGIGTREFKPNEYLRKVNFSKYDFFIIVSSGRFTVHDAMLALAIKEMNKQFYFVRTKVDQDMDNERRKPNFSETQTLEKIRKDCCSNLIKEGLVSLKVFLMSRWHLNMYDFPIFHKTLADDLKDLKRPLLIMAMPAFSKEHLQEKKAVMEKLIWKNAFTSCSLKTRFLRAFSSGNGNNLLLSTLKDICRTFGLDEDSLHNLAERIGKQVVDLKSAVRKTPMVSQINLEFVESLLTKCRQVDSETLLEKICSFIPVLGSLVGGHPSFPTTYCMLKGFLKDAMEDAENVLAKAAE